MDQGIRKKAIAAGLVLEFIFIHKLVNATAPEGVSRKIVSKFRLPMSVILKAE